MVATASQFLEDFRSVSRMMADHYQQGLLVSTNLVQKLQHLHLELLAFINHYHRLSGLTAIAARFLEIPPVLGGFSHKHAAETHPSL